LNTTFPLGLTAEKAELEKRDLAGNTQYLIQTLRTAYENKAAIENPDALKGLERYIILNAIDRLWQEHLYAMDGLREAVYLRAFGQKDPLIEYKNDAYAMFVELMDNIKLEVLGNLFRGTTNLQAFESLLRSLPQQLLHAEAPGMAAAPTAPVAQPPGNPPAGDGPRLEIPVRRDAPKVGRNDPCPCGSGKKYKACCGRTA
jgi:preprotein translocase subunit SecA